MSKNLWYMLAVAVLVGALALLGTRQQFLLDLAAIVMFVIVIQVSGLVIKRRFAA